MAKNSWTRDDAGNKTRITRDKLIRPWYFADGTGMSLTIRYSDVASAIDYILKRWRSFARFLEDGRICLTNNAAERALRGLALGRKAWLFAGSDRGSQRAAFLYSLIVTAKLNDVDPQAWPADIFARIADHPVRRIDKLHPWNWKSLGRQHIPDAA